MTRQPCEHDGIFSGCTSTQVENGQQSKQVGRVGRMLWIRALPLRNRKNFVRGFIDRKNAGIIPQMPPFICLLEQVASHARPSEPAIAIAPSAINAIPFGPRLLFGGEWVAWAWLGLGKRTAQHSAPASLPPTGRGRSPAHGPQRVDTVPYRVL